MLSWLRLRVCFLLRCEWLRCDLLWCDLLAWLALRVCFLLRWLALRCERLWWERLRWLALRDWLRCDVDKDALLDWERLRDRWWHHHHHHGQNGVGQHSPYTSTVARDVAVKLHVPFTPKGVGNCVCHVRSHACLPMHAVDTMSVTSLLHSVAVNARVRSHVPGVGWPKSA